MLRVSTVCLARETVTALSRPKLAVHAKNTESFRECVAYQPLIKRCPTSGAYLFTVPIAATIFMVNAQYNNFSFPAALADPAAVSVQNNKLVTKRVLLSSFVSLLCVKGAKHPAFSAILFTAVGHAQTRAHTFLPVCYGVICTATVCTAHNRITPFGLIVLAALWTVSHGPF